MLRIPGADGLGPPAPRLPLASGENPAAAFSQEGGAGGYIAPPPQLTKGLPARGEPAGRPESDGLEPEKAPILFARTPAPPAQRCSKPQIRPPGPQRVEE